jgi:hypothetical protein
MALQLILLLVLCCVVASRPQEKAQAQAFANALSTIGKFQLKKKVGEKDTIYGRWVAVSAGSGVVCYRRVEGAAHGQLVATSWL